MVSCLHVGGVAHVRERGDVVTGELLRAIGEVVDVTVGHDRGGAGNGGKDSGVLEGRHFCRFSKSVEFGVVGCSFRSWKEWILTSSRKDSELQSMKCSNERNVLKSGKECGNGKLRE